MYPKKITSGLFQPVGLSHDAQTEISAVAREELYPSKSLRPGG